MDTNFTQKEVLLMMSSRFSSRQWCEKDDQGNAAPRNIKDQLEEACWNGLLPEMLPEIFEKQASEDIYLWKVKQTSAFLELELGQSPGETDKFFSIDPYTILVSRDYN